MEMLVLGAIIAGLCMLVLLLRVPSSVAFFSLLVGQLLATEASSDVYDFAASMINVPEARYVQLALLGIPFVLTVLFMKGRAKKSQFIVELVPALFVALVVVLLAM